jgi:hypothetical protein
MLSGPSPAELRGCSKPGCPNNASARGLCKTCYQDARRNGTLPAKLPRTHYTSMKAWVPAEVDKALRKLSRITGKPCSEIVREALAKHLGVPL